MSPYSEEEDWEMKSVGRYLFKVLVDHTSLEAKKTVVGAPKRDGVEAYRLLTRQYDPFSYDVASQMLENILIVGRATPKNLEQLDQVFKELYKRMNEFEVASGGVAKNVGEKFCEVKINVPFRWSTRSARHS